MTSNKPPSPAMEAPLAQVEQALIREYLLTRGHNSHSLQGLADSQREALLKEASTDASDKLCKMRRDRGSSKGFTRRSATSQRPAKPDGRQSRRR